MCGRGINPECHSGVQHGTRYIFCKLPIPTNQPTRTPAPKRIRTAITSLAPRRRALRSAILAACASFVGLRAEVASLTIQFLISVATAFVLHSPSQQRGHAEGCDNLEPYCLGIKVKREQRRSRSIGVRSKTTTRTEYGTRTCIQMRTASGLLPIVSATGSAGSKIVFS